MHKKLTIFAAVSTIVALGTVALADGPRGLPPRYAPRSMDGRIHQVEVLASQTTIATWAYRNGARFDIAVSTAQADGDWSEPVFFGRDDERDQIEPVVAADAHGNVFLAYTDRDEGRVMLAIRPAGRTDWSTPLPVTPLASGAETPSLLVTEDRLVVAFQIDRQIHLFQLPLPGDGTTSTLGLTDGSDPVGHEDGSPPPSDENQGIDSGASGTSRYFAPFDKKIYPPTR
ncbi:MAG TPA: hypothetical protein VD788_16885 [Candidatus Polarisedimenticolaceae bacterium]|nr:hypothetical protein [Candidatus Polarisedimenticolaceae bacterium]